MAASPRGRLLSEVCCKGKRRHRVDGAASVFGVNLSYRGWVRSISPATQALQPFSEEIIEMNLAKVLGLHSGQKVIATRSGQVDGKSYGPGSVGRVSLHEGDSPQVALLNGDPLGYVDLRNWEVLTRCSYCSEDVAANSLVSCSSCQRPGNCPKCFEQHNPCVDPPPVVQSRTRHRRPVTKRSMSQPRNGVNNHAFFIASAQGGSGVRGYWRARAGLN